MYRKAKLAAVAVLSLMVGVNVNATQAENSHADFSDLDRVKNFRTLGGMSGWQVLDRQSLIVNVSPSRSYLLVLQRPSNSLRFANEIGITSTVGQVHARFDNVIVDGWRYPIKSIYALDREQAKDLASRCRKS